jgi:hypothetical protein
MNLNMYAAFQYSDEYIYTIHGLIVFSLIVASVLSRSCSSYQRVLRDGLVCLFRDACGSCLPRDDHYNRS